MPKKRRVSRLRISAPPVSYPPGWEFLKSLNLVRAMEFSNGSRILGPIKSPRR
jgi:hypothetical protein